MKRLLTILLLMLAVSARGATIFPITSTSDFIGSFPTNYNQSISNLNAAIGGSDLVDLSNGVINVGLKATNAVCAVSNSMVEVSSPTNYINIISNQFIGCTQWFYFVRCFTNVAAAGGGASSNLIAEQIITSEVTTVTFSGIPQTYKLLKIVANVQGNRANANGDNLGFRINNDSATNYMYWYYYLNGDGSFNSDEVLGADFGYLGAVKGSIGSTGLYSVAYCEIPDYADGTKWKSWITLSHAALTNAASKAYFYNTGGNYYQASSITTLVFVLSYSNLVSGSICLWGL